MRESKLYTVGRSSAMDSACCQTYLDVKQRTWDKFTFKKSHVIDFTINCLLFLVCNNNHSIGNKWPCRHVMALKVCNSLVVPAVFQALPRTWSQCHRRCNIQVYEDCPSSSALTMLRRRYLCIRDVVTVLRPLSKPRGHFKALLYYNFPCTTSVLQSPRRIHI